MEVMDDKDIVNSLFNAAANGQVADVRRLLANGGNIECKDERTGETPLFAAKNNVDIASLLIEADADVNARDFQGKTPLMSAGRDVCLKLLSCGANPLILTSDGILASQMCEKETYPVILVAIIDAILEIYNEEKLMIAADLIDMLVSAHSDIPVQYKSTFSEIQAEGNMARILKRELECDDGWNVCGTRSDGVRVSHRALEGSPIQKLKIECTVKAPCHHCIAVLYEVDLFTTWLPSILREAKILARHSPYRILVQARAKIPFPLIDDRDCVMSGWGCDNLERDGSMVIVLQSSENGPPPCPGEKRMDIKVAGFMFHPLDDATTRVSFLVHVDPLLPLLPDWLLNWATRVISPLFVNAMRDKAESIINGGIYVERITSQPEVYDLIIDRCKMYLSS